VLCLSGLSVVFSFFNDMSTAEIYTLSLHDALPILGDILLPRRYVPAGCKVGDALDVFVYVDSEDRLVATTDKPRAEVGECAYLRSEEHTSELQSRENLVCRLLLEKKNTKETHTQNT